ncbi:hypothetical protein ANCCAN_07183 [Ancylostoma caninum]|uniref:Uncharacterized protein n=1 Tax=Ancylostoma caninum TaxID=29170 RepID=A0A368GQT9_ANCCA|nr:hypothetical protein ANCCAN_07183 [Ancylostoma caninum]
MSLDLDIYGGVLQCHDDQYTCESLCAFECWTVRTCEHRATSNYVCIPKPQIIVLSFVIWCALTIAALTVISLTCWRSFRFRCLGGHKVHAGLIRSVSDLENRIQVGEIKHGYV